MKLKPFWLKPFWLKSAAFRAAGLGQWLFWLKSFVRLMRMCTRSSWRDPCRLAASCVSAHPRCRRAVLVMHRPTLKLAAADQMVGDSQNDLIGLSLDEPCLCRVLPVPVAGALGDDHDRGRCLAKWTTCLRWRKHGRCWWPRPASYIVACAWTVDSSEDAAIQWCYHDFRDWALAELAAYWWIRDLLMPFFVGAVMVENEAWGVCMGRSVL